VSRPPRRGQPWTADERTGGPLDDILDQVRRHNGDLVVERLQVTHPADDDNVYFLGDTSRLDRVQLDTAPNGQPPFLIEAHESMTTSDPTLASTVIQDWLGHSSTPSS
jgi:hypothetical protein